MKANELMIGDWVMLSDCKIPIRMEDVSGSQLFKRWADNGDTCIHFSYTEIEPIPLTEEILKENGLDPIICCDLSMPKWYMSLRNGNNYVGMSFEYVHQLQHALRLCGLTELADNFRIG